MSKTETMKAAIAAPNSSGIAVPRITEMPAPQPRKGEVAVQIAAMCLGPSCLDVYYQKYASLPAKRKRTDTPATGIEFSGVALTDGNLFKKGDEVVGAIDYMKGARTHGEQTVIPETFLARKPPMLSHVEAASCIVGALTAIEALLVLAKIGKKSTVLINGATGSVGIYAVQIAQSIGCEITATCSPRNFDYLKSLGVHTVSDYRHNANFAPNHYDLIFDAAGKWQFNRCKSYLKPHGTFITTQPLKDVWGFVRSWFGSRKSKFLFVPHSGKNRFERWQKLIETGAIQPVVDSVYPLADIGTAAEKYHAHSAVGKIVIEVE